MVITWPNETNMPIKTGDKYTEIPPNSKFIQSPGTLIPNIKRHIKVVTDESNSCRRYAKMESALKMTMYLVLKSRQTNLLMRGKVGSDSKQGRSCRDNWG